MDQYVFPFNDVDNIELVTLINENRFGIFSTARLMYFDPICVSDSYNSDTDPDAGICVSISNKIGSNCSNYCELNDLPILLNASDSKLFIKVISQNIRSLNKNFDEFFHDVERINFDVIALTETWLSNDVAQLYTKYQNYSGTFLNRNSIGGGVGFFVSNVLQYDVIDDLTYNESDIECLFIKLNYYNHMIIIGNIYRPPKGDTNIFIDKIETLLNHCRLNFTHYPLYLLGDYNIDLLKHSENIKTQIFLNTMFSYNLCPVIRRPTRVTEFSASLIDHIWTNDIRIKNSGIVKNFVSDHHSVFF